MGAWNFFRILGDLSHITSKCILIFAIQHNKSAEGVSMITQVLYALVFCFRYTDVFRERYVWNLIFKIFYIFSSLYIIAIMRWRYPRTREREIAWKLGAAALGGSLVLAPLAMLILDNKQKWSFFTFFWDFSQILESVAVLPQLLLLRQTTVPTVINSGYILTLGSYRALYILNWIWRELDISDLPPNAISVIFGVIQTAFYIDFAWVYYTRQRVKLRNGGIVDADDMRRGWLLSKIFGNKRFAAEHDDEGDEESAPALGGRRNGNASGPSGGGGRGGSRSKWGTRGISISADDTTHEHEAGQSVGEPDDFTDGVDPDAKISDPDDLARALDDEDDDDDEDAPLHSGRGAANRQPSGVNNGNEWRD